MRILKLQAENIKKLSVVEITPDGELVQITGKNGSGKTSVLDSIWWALAGTKNIQQQPIRKGEDKARINLDLGELEVTRTFSEHGSQLYVKANGAVYRSPQTVLDNLLGSLSFDPLAFIRMEPRKQFDTLKLIAKLKVDIEALDKANNLDYEKRHGINLRKKALDARIGAFPEFPATLPPSEVNSAALGQQLAAAMARNADLTLTEQRKQDSLSRARSNRDKAEKKIADLESLLVQAREDMARFASQISELESQSIQEHADVSGLQTQLTSAEQTNRLIQQRAERNRLMGEARELNKQSDDLTDAMEKRGKEKQDAITSAKMPVKGLTFGDGVVLYRGIPLEQASSAEQLKVSCAIGMAGNPKLRVMIIKDGSLLDSDSLKLLASMAKENDWQIWIERVDTSGKVGIVMEDGHVKTRIKCADCGNNLDDDFEEEDEAED